MEPPNARGIIGLDPANAPCIIPLRFGRREMTDKKYCENCKHCFVPPSGLKYARCAKFPSLAAERFISKEFDEWEEHRYCSSVRVNDELCGSTAKLFEAKEVANA